MALDRVKKVKEYRLASKRSATQKLAERAYLFWEIRQPNTNYIVIPRVSSERRKYIPIGFLDKDVITSNRCTIISTNSLYTIGVLMSIMHMTWTKYVCGRLKNDYRYSKDIVYTIFLGLKT